mmetsp:Transcript_23705/g.42221  ORF Transcript_23705/g.42221 Transcript_23705/m.42221 type:complete len:180 (-) Transcript_23705:1006-1545(-)
MVILGQGALALENLDRNHSLLVLVGGEGLGLLGGNDGVAGNELGHDAANGLDAQRQRSHIEKEDILELLMAISTEDATLHSSAKSNGLIGIDASVRLLAIEKLLQELLDFGNAGGSTDQDDLVNFAFLEASVFKSLLHGAHGLAEEIHVELLEAGAGKGFGQIHSIVQSLNLDTYLVLV